jgi:hypothetical protein
MLTVALIVDEAAGAVFAKLVAPAQELQAVWATSDA